MKIAVDWDLEGPSRGSFFIDPEDFVGLNYVQISQLLQEYVEDEVKQRVYPAATYEDDVCNKIMIVLEAINNV